MSIWFKVLPFIRNGERIKKCIDFFGQSDFAPRDTQEQEIIDECVAICRRNCTAYFCGIIITVILWNVPVYFGKEKTFPVQLWLPYDPISSSLIYYGTLFYATAVIMYDALLGTVTDPLIGGLAYHATAQLKILKYNLQTLDKHIEDGLTLATVASVNALTYLFSASIISFQILFYCHYGTLLYEENNSLINAICMGPWYQYDVKIRKMLLIIMERSKRPMILTAGAVINVTLETFVWVLKSSYSLVAVLNNYG
ncbi:odorant receptor Or1-like [Zophobas morio]|uniref:odorant receptor Or1-like n=1 Tax=Zophobas morio TaxID=2755281 RepID=UPI003083A4A3